MVLNAENRLFKVTEAGHGAVIEMPMGHFGACCEQAVLIDTESVILARDLHSIGQQVANRLIRPPMPEFQFPGRGPQRQGQQLMAQADSEGRNRSSDASDPTASPSTHCSKTSDAIASRTPATDGKTSMSKTKSLLPRVRW